MSRIKSIEQFIYLAINNLSKDGQVFTHLTIDEKIILHKLSRNLKNNSVVAEIGSYLGASSCFIANGLNRSCKLYCIDTWGNHAMAYEEKDKKDDKLIEKNTYNLFRQNTEKYRNKIIELQGWSTDVIANLKLRESNLDFLFIDGDHNYEGVKKDWDLYSTLLNKGALVAFHDIGWAEGVLKVIREDVLPIADLVCELPNLGIYRIR